MKLFMWLPILSILCITYPVVNLYSQERSCMEWSEFSFVLKPSPLGGIGVFATHDIPAGTQLFNMNFEFKNHEEKRYSY